MADGYRIVPVEVGGAEIRMEVREIEDGGPVQVGILEALPFSDITKAIEAMGKELSLSLARISPNKASVELGLEVGFEAGKLVALIANGSAKANLKVKLEWQAEPALKA